MNVYSQSSKRHLAMAIMLLILCQASYGQETIRAITRPSKDLTLSFLPAGRIGKIHVREGDHVSKGQLLVEEDSSLEEARLEQLRARKENTTQVEASKARWEQKQVDVKKFERAARENAATELEVQHARLDAKIARLSWETAQFQHRQDIRKYEEAKLEVERMKLASPIEGRVEKLFIEEGEAVDSLTEVIRVVDTAPLWINVHVPVSQARKLRPGDPAQVRFPGAEALTLTGEILYISAVVDADTLTVRVEVPNKEQRPAGEQVRVSFTEKTTVESTAGRDS